MTNIVLLTIDSLRADHCSSYGYDRGTTPNLDAFATDGARFENAYSASSHTREAVPAFVTGEYPHAAIDDNYHIAKPSIATLLKETHHTGAFHSNPFLSRTYGYDRDFDTFDDDLCLSRHKLVALAQRFWDKLRGHHYARAEIINERALAWLDSLADDQPFFLWNHYMDVHGPYEPPEPYRSDFDAREVDTATAQEFWDTACKNPETVSENLRETLLSLYDGEIAHNDAQIGVFLEALESRGLLADALVVITSDHGELFGETEDYSHPRSVHDKLLEVPLFVSGPDVPKVAVEAPVTLLDIVPTLCRAVGVDGGDVPGVALQDVWGAPDSFTDRHVISEAVDRDERVRRYQVNSIDANLTYDYDLDSDEVRVSSAEGPELAESLITHIESAKSDSQGIMDTSETDDELSARLEALGYR